MRVITEHQMAAVAAVIAAIVVYRILIARGVR